ncbi:unnamed protein product, partial [Brachionus calyciflorus]
RHQKCKILNHPAQALKVHGIFTRIAIDLVFGLPVTEEGYKSIMRRKSANTLALYFFVLPPKIVLSDQDTEFNNKLEDGLIKWVGAEHKITSAYNPRTNGLTERFNQTLIEPLRKHAETTPNNWDKWLPYVLMAYRCRIHSTTQFTPFELMFGRNMNKADELKKLSEEIQQMALVKIDEVQKEQKRIQDKRTKPLIDSLEIGTTVFIKNEGILGKLEARYSGPYSISKVTSSGDFHYCDHETNNNVFLDLENSCSPLGVSTRNKIISSGENWYMALLVKQKHLIHGTGFKCKIEIKTSTFSESFLGYQTESSKSHYAKLSKEECEYMVKTKICNGSPMTCENENCFYEKEPVEVFNWWKTVTKNGVKCSVTAIVINGDSLDQRLFNSINHPCKASSLECPLHDSIIIWDSKIIQKCLMNY